ncbi:hypothetical protein CPB83DRAFT_873547 [Crepidotus variabilis]|uniref:Enoyl reductase (ER) domain-containing protein n=1 Tax=Crepidotus variabilis TaxID=179855 RepID=A0A9P6EQY4_9AGAR|nr:hypothetical protein CPB83DRAFT_873547 [Crepidotus variabilis]
MDSIPNQQHAWVNLRRGEPAEALEYRADWPVSKNLEPGEALVKVHAAALNPAGYKLMKFLPNFVANRPLGDQVFGWVRSDHMRLTNQGALCQYAKVREDWIAYAPSNIPLDEVAGFAIVGITAHDMTVKNADLQAGQRIFVNGGSTSVGAIAIQIAKSRGVHVTASASAKNEAFVRRQGADEFVDYTTVSLPEFLWQRAEEGRKFDYIFEMAGVTDPSMYTQSDSYLSPMGFYATVGPQPKGLYLSEIWNLMKTTLFWHLPRVLGGPKAPFKLVCLDYQREDLEQLQRYISEGAVKPIVDSTYNFKDTLQAYERLMNGKIAGKVIVKVNIEDN